MARNNTSNILSDENEQIVKPTIDKVYGDKNPAEGIDNGGTTEESILTLSGTGRPGAPISIYDNGEYRLTTTVGADGTWSYRLRTSGTGEHAYTVEVDRVASEPYTVTYSAPEAPETPDTPDMPENPEVPDTSEDPQTPDEPEHAPVTIDSAYYIEDGVVAHIPDGGFTDDATPFLSGRGKPHSQVDLYDNGVLITSVTADELGVWTLETPELTSGDHAFSVESGGERSAPYHIAIEVAPQEPEEPKPTIDAIYDDVGTPGDIENGGVTDDNSPTLSGTGKPLTPIAIYDGDNLLVIVTVGADGTWSYTPRAITEGEHVFTVSGVGGTSEPYTITVTAPEPQHKLEILSIFDDVGTQGHVANGGTTDDSTPTLIGTGKPGSEVKIYDKGHLLGTVTVGAEGNWSYTTPTLAQGEYAFAVESNGVRSEPYSVSVDIPKEPENPKPTISAVYDDMGGMGNVENGGTTADATLMLRGTGQPGTQVKIYDNGELLTYALVEADGTWGYSTWKLSQGDHTFTVVNAQTGGVSEPYGVTVDVNSAPKPTISAVYDDMGGTGNVENGGTTADATLMLRGTGQPGTQVKIYDNGQFLTYALVEADGTWGYSTWKLSQGDHTFTVVNAQTGGVSEPYSVTVDVNSAPKPTISAVYDDMGGTGNVENGGTTADATLMLRGTGQPGTQVKIYDNGELLTYALVEADGTWGYSTWKLSQGDHTFTVVNAQTGGVSEPYGVTVDANSAPKPTLQTVDDAGNVENGGVTTDNTLTLSGSGQPGTQVKIYDNGQFLTYALVEENGKWNYEPRALALGEHSFTVVIAGATSEPYTFTVVESKMPEQEAPEQQPVTIESAYDVEDGFFAHIPDGGYTEDATPFLSGKGLPGSQVDIFDKGVLITSTTADDVGYWYVVTEPLTAGDHVFTVVSEGIHSQPYSVTIGSADVALATAEDAPALPAMGELLHSADEVFASDVAQPATEGKKLTLSDINLEEQGFTAPATGDSTSAVPSVDVTLQNNDHLMQ